MVGISFALLLARQCPDMRLLLLESKADTHECGIVDTSFDSRATALSYNSGLILEDMGIWTLLRTSLAEIDGIHVSNLNHFGVTRISSSDVNVEALGYVVENQTMGAILAQKLAESNITSLFSSKIAKVELRERSLKILLEDRKNPILTQLLIIADGANSETAKKIGIQTRITDHQQSAIVANITLKHQHRQLAYERFIKDGSLALLPMSSYQGKPRASLVWIQSTEETNTMMLADDASFLTELQAEFGNRAGLFTAVGERRSYELATTEAEEQVRRRLVLLGNAARGLHPIAGQGFNLALRDAEVLSSCIAEALENGSDCYSMETLEKYLDARWLDQQKVLAFTKLIPKLFATDSYPLAIGRNVGLLLMDLSHPLRKVFAKFGMGL